MKKKVWAVLFSLVFMAQGCSSYTAEKAYKAAHKKLTGLEAYSCKAEIYVKGNKEPGQFKTKQWFYIPDKYRLEVLEPETMKGKTTVFDGNRIWMYYPYIDQVLLLENIDSSTDANLFLGFFLRDMLETESISYSIEEQDGTTMIVIELPVPGVNKYRSTQKLFMSIRNFLPVMLEIYDVNGNVTARVKYSDFVYNPKLDGDFFDKDKIVISMVYEEWDASGMFFDSVEQAREHLDFPPLRVYGMPEGFIQDIVQVVENNNAKTLIVTYGNNEQSLILLQKAVGKGEGKSHQSGELIYLDDREAFYSERNNTRKISWMEGNVRIELVGSITRMALTEIARSIK